MLPSESLKAAVDQLCLAVDQLCVERTNKRGHDEATERQPEQKRAPVCAHVCPHVFVDMCAGRGTSSTSTVLLRLIGHNDRLSVREVTLTFLLPAI